MPDDFRAVTMPNPDLRTLLARRRPGYMLEAPFYTDLNPSL